MKNSNTEQPKPSLMRAFRLEISCMFGRNLKEQWVWTIDAPEAMSLLEIHDHILQEIGFKEDHHLFGFCYGDKFGLRKEGLIKEETEWGEGYKELNENDYDDIRLSEIYPIKKRNRWLSYIFDYGDSWEFMIKKIGRDKKVDEEVQYPATICKTGQNPKQYAHWDEE